MKGISYGPLSDMHSDGVYFNREEQLNPLVSLVDNSIDAGEPLCHYSGLPSVSSYVKEEEFHQGHS